MKCRVHKNGMKILIKEEKATEVARTPLRAVHYTAPVKHTTNADALAIYFRRFS